MKLIVFLHIWSKVACLYLSSQLILPYLCCLKTYESTNLRNEPFIKQREEEERQILIKEEERLNKQMKEKEEL